MSPRRQRALIALGFFGIGLLLTLVTVQLADSSNFIRSVLLFICLPVVFVGTQILPNSITVPYDPVGHPWALHLGFPDKRGDLWPSRFRFMETNQMGETALLWTSHLTTGSRAKRRLCRFAVLLVACSAGGAPAVQD